VIRLSDSRISHLAHLVLDGLRKDRLAEFSSEGRSLAETKQVLRDFFKVKNISTKSSGKRLHPCQDKFRREAVNGTFFIASISKKKRASSANKFDPARTRATRKLNQKTLT